MKMGIKGLMKLIKEVSPESVIERNKKHYVSKIIAIDASMQLYQFMIQIRIQGSDGIEESLTDKNGEITSHILGFFTRTINLLELGIKPIYVFDGKPPAFKFKELKKRSEQKKKASAEVESLMSKLKVSEQVLDDHDHDHEVVMEDNIDSSMDIETDQDTEQAELRSTINKLNKRNVHITKEQINDIKKLLTYMGVPYVDAPGEAEAQCAELVRTGKAYAVGTEDMDCLTFGAKVMLKSLTDSRTKMVQEIHLDKVLSGMKLSYEQFIDLCILCGCDYSGTISGIGPKKSIQLIRKHGSIEEILKSINRDKHYVSETLDNDLEEVRSLFTEPDMIKGSEIKIKFNSVDKDNLIRYLVSEKCFSRERVERSIKKIEPMQGQKSIDSFFKVKPKNNT
jgi:flap endonuclease-1